MPSKIKSCEENYFSAVEAYAYPFWKALCLVVRPGASIFAPQGELSSFSVLYAHPTQIPPL